MNNAPCPLEVKEIHEIMAYEAMCYLYQRYNAKQIDATEAAAEKQKIVDAYNEAEKKIRESEYCTQRKIDFFNKAEHAVTRFNKAQTLEDKVEAAEDFVAIMYNQGTRMGRNTHVTAHREPVEASA